MTGPIDAAIVGLGRWGKGIVEAVQGKSRHLRFTRGVCLEPEVMRDFARTHGLALTDKFEDAVSDPQVRAVVLATPHSLHVDQVVAIARAGKAVWCEKPLALTRRAAERAVAACRDAGAVLGLGNNKRLFPAMVALEGIVAAGKLGEIMHIEGHFSNEHSTRVMGGWRDDPAESPGGGMTGAGLHILDAFVNLVGPVRAVDGRLFSRKPPPDPRDVAAVMVEFATGATGLMATVRAGPAYWRVHVFGTTGWAEVRGETALTVARMGEPPKTTELPAADSLALLLDRFAIAAQGGPPFPVSPAQMLDVVAAFEAVIESMRTTRPVELNRGGM